ncbi:uncharacterized protein BX664DRAFT_264234 [Halteromyces radiatus]|uniref:uncharacterized protein n=1 Tax=Halteromyces radiatus TaxID=101107 RepID=UPI00221FE307|nr:uncharacterized protein BX664DRAFT_264234 [Halteromyces radiatus]KAI8090062.1 hypothetical protein BX664DRAFT_264234 [Halteromyces radiatus]
MGTFGRLGKILTGNSTIRGKSSTSSSVRTRHTIKTRLQSAKSACNEELRLILDGLNEYVEQVDLPFVQQQPPADLLATSHPMPSRYAGISEDTYLPTPFILALQDLIGLAQNVLDTPLDIYLDNIGVCASVVSQIQIIGSRWDKHTEWPCREWYVRLLLCVAALNRVIEWWEAERASHMDYLDNSSDSNNTSGNTLLQQAVKRSQSNTIVMELTLETNMVQYLSPVWQQLFGSDLQTVVGNDISELLAPDDRHVFSSATTSLLEDTTRIVDIQFNINVQQKDVLMISMEGKGMIMYNRVTGEPNHTMWYFLQHDDNIYSFLEQDSSPVVRMRSISEPMTATAIQISPASLMSLPPVLCRVCERLVVAAFFEQHSELCVEEHRTEMDVIICNDSLRELKLLVLGLIEKSRLDNNNTIQNQEKGTIDFADDVSLCWPLSMELEHDENVLLDGNLPMDDSCNNTEEQRLNDMAIGKELLDILEVALSIPTPNSQADTRNKDNVDQDLMTLTKSNMVQILYWRPSPTDNPSYQSLIHDIQHVTKTKVDSVNRMRDRLEYNRRLRMDFERNMQQEKGWTEYVEDKNQNQEEKGSFFDNSNNNNDNGNNHVDQVCADPLTDDGIHPKAKVPVSEQPRKSFLGRWKSWKNKRTSDMSRFARRRKRKAHSLAVQPRIMEMETIDTPLASPGMHPKYHHLALNDNNVNDNNNKDPTLSDSIQIAKNQVQTTLSTLTTLPTLSHRSTQPTIKDYDIIKPISKGAFGSVFLAKKRLTGDYYAIKFLKKSDMIAKNQVTNVKAERMILMTQTDSPFVTKLYYTFQSKDYLYLVLEYLNGGDCSALIKAMDRLPEDWARNYLAEVTLGLTYLYHRNIIHRDLKPDNLLIDQNGHLKLTDFGLSRIGFLDRRVRDELGYVPLCNKRAPSPTSPAPSRSNTPPYIGSPSVSIKSTFSPVFSNLYKHSYFSALFERNHQRRGSFASSTSGGCDFGNSNDNSSIYQQPSSGTSSNGHTKHPISTFSDSVDPSYPTKRQGNHDLRAIGTPDYIAPESILGTGQDSMVDWWALGVICYEFIYGYPPFNDESPDKVFENILSRRINWHEDEIVVSAECRDFMERLMTLDPDKRLGASGPDEVKQHAFFKNIDWDNLLTKSPAFVPQLADDEDTAYFDSRGATMEDHQVLEENQQAQVDRAKSIIMEQNPGNVTSILEHHDEMKHIQMNDNKHNSFSFVDDGDDFGAFVYKNLPLLEKANEDTIRKMRHDSIIANVTSPSLSSAGGSTKSGSSSSPVNWIYRSLPAISRKKRNSIFDLDMTTTSNNNNNRRPSSSTLYHIPFTTSLPTTPRNISPSTSSKMSSTSSPTSYASQGNNVQPKNDKEKISRSKLIDNTQGSLRTRSISSPGNQIYTSDFQNNNGIDNDNRIMNRFDIPNAPVDDHHPALRHVDTIIPNHINSTSGKPWPTLDCLLADDNPISCKILETILDRLNCRCVIVRNGAQAIRYAMGNVQFDLIFMDIRMPIIDGEAAARMIKSTKNHNQKTTIIAVTAYERTVQLADTFDDVISKPVTKEMIQQRLQLFYQRNVPQDGDSPRLSPHEDLEQSSLKNISSVSDAMPIPIPRYS